MVWIPYNVNDFFHLLAFEFGKIWWLTSDLKEEACWRLHKHELRGEVLQNLLTLWSNVLHRSKYKTFDGPQEYSSNPNFSIIIISGFMFDIFLSIKYIFHYKICVMIYLFIRERFILEIVYSIDTSFLSWNWYRYSFNNYKN